MDRTVPRRGGRGGGGGGGRRGYFSCRNPAIESSALSGLRSEVGTSLAPGLRGPPGLRRAAGTGASGGRRARQLPSPEGGRSGRGRGRGGSGLPAGLAGAPGALPRRGEWEGRDGQPGRGAAREGCGEGQRAGTRSACEPLGVASVRGEPGRAAAARSEPGGGEGRGTRPRQQLSPPRPPRRAGWRSERRGRVSGREGAGAPRELAPTSLPWENPAEAERSLSAPAQPIGRRARVGATAAGARSVGGQQQSRARGRSRWPRRRGASAPSRYRPGSAPPPLERRSQGRCVAWFLSLMVVPDCGIDQTGFRVHEMV